MTLFLISLTIIAAVLTAIEFSQAARPRRIRVWNDDVERRHVRARSRPSDRW